MHKHTKYNSLIKNIQNQGWKTNPLVIIRVGVRGAIHEQSINKLINLQIPMSNIKTLMKNMNQNSIKYLTYLVFNKRKNLKINMRLSHLPKTKGLKQNTSAHLPKRHKPSYYNTVHRVKIFG